MKRLNLLMILWLCAGAALAATNRSAAQYYRDAASEYIAGQNASAAQTCEEGLRAHPGDSRLQKLLERIRDNQEQQKKQCQNPQDSDSLQNKDKDQEKKPNQNQNKNQNKQDKNDKNQNGSGSSNSQNQSGQGASSSSASGNGMSEQAMPMRPGELNREQAQQLLKDFNQNSGERKAWRPIRGQSAPEKDW